MDLQEPESLREMFTNEGRVVNMATLGLLAHSANSALHESVPGSSVHPCRASCLYVALSDAWETQTELQLPLHVAVIIIATTFSSLLPPSLRPGYIPSSLSGVLISS